MKMSQVRSNSVTIRLFPSDFKAVIFSHVLLSLNQGLRQQKENKMREKRTNFRSDGFDLTLVVDWNWISTVPKMFSFYFSRCSYSSGSIGKPLLLSSSLAVWKISVNVFSLNVLRYKKMCTLWLVYSCWKYKQQPSRVGAAAAAVPCFAALSCGIQGAWFLFAYCLGPWLQSRSQFWLHWATWNVENDQVERSSVEYRVLDFHTYCQGRPWLQSRSQFWLNWASRNINNNHTELELQPLLCRALPCHLQSWSINFFLYFTT